MNKLRKKHVILILKIGSLGMLLGATVLVGYIYISVNELKLKLTRLNLEKSSTAQQTSTLEKGGIIDRESLKNYLLFTDNKNFRIDENNSERISGGKFIITDSTQLPQLLENSCERYNCLQFKASFEQIPSTIWKALLGTEDFRFLEHRGIDYIAIGRAIVADIVAMKFVQGGSTLTQQLVKNLFLTSEKTISRKVKELIYAFYIENILEKDEIVALYLNEVFWGTFQGIYLKGFYSSSLAYFDKVPSELSAYESVILISLLKGPYFYHPEKNLDRLKNRANAVLERLKGLNLLSDRTQSWNDQAWTKWQKGYLERSKGFSFKTHYSVSQNTDTELEGFEKFILVDGVYSVQRLLKSRTNKADIGIKILVFNKRCNSFDCPETFSFYSKTQRDKRAAMLDESHQVGSLLKPIVYESFIAHGKAYDDMVSTEPITLELKSGPWTPKDYSKAKEDEVSLKVALQKSKNIPLIRLAHEIGFDKIEQSLAQYIPKLKSPLAEYPAQLLGAVELTMGEVMSSYNKFIKDECAQVIRDDVELENSVLYYMSQAQETTISNLAQGSIKNAAIFGKTGTSNNGFDNWFFAFDGEEYYLIWFGVESGRTDASLRLTGGSSAFRIFQNFINNRGKLTSELHCQ